SVINPALANPIVAKVTAPEAWTNDVIEKPVTKPRIRVLVQLCRRSRRAAPAATFNPSVINHIPTRINPSPPSNTLIVVIELFNTLSDYFLLKINRASKLSERRRDKAKMDEKAECTR